MRITLANLAEATAQQVFDQVAEHLLRQGRKSLAAGSTSTCCYRGPENLKCAVGCLIADDEYDKEWDVQSATWTKLVDDGLVPIAHQPLIVRLQQIHDCSFPANWAADLEMVADFFCLSPAVVTSFRALQ